MEKRCTTCGVVKPATHDFWHLAKKGKYGLAAKCRECKLAQIYRINTPERKRAYYEANKAKHSAANSARRSRQRRENPEEWRKYYRAWRDNNRERYREMMRAGKANRTARKRAAGGKVTHADIEKMKAAQKGRCWWCQQPYGRYHLDHRIPLAKGGSNQPNNTVLSCGPCNQRKNARMPWQIDNPRLL